MSDCGLKPAVGGKIYGNCGSEAEFFGKGSVRIAYGKGSRARTVSRFNDAPKRPVSHMRGALKGLTAVKAPNQLSSNAPV